MVVATQVPIPSEKIKEIELPIIDLTIERSKVSNLIVKACEEFGFFKVINHGVPEFVINRMEAESWGFFEKPGSEKQRAGPANPYGYGSKTIGFKGILERLNIFFSAPTLNPFLKDPKLSPLTQSNSGTSIHFYVALLYIYVIPIF